MITISALTWKKYTASKNKCNQKDGNSKKIKINARNEKFYK